MFARISWPPILGILLVDIAIELTQSSNPPTQLDSRLSYEWVAQNTSYFGAIIVWLLIYSFLTIAFAVQWHRVILLKSPESLEWRSCWPSIWQYFLYFAGMYVVPPILGGAILLFFLSIGDPYSATSSFFVFAVLLSVCAFTACLPRLTLVFPAAACGFPASLREAWRRMKGNTWRLIGASALSSIIMIIVLMAGVAVFTLLFLGADVTVSHFFGAPTYDSLGFLITAILIQTLKVSFSFLVIALFASIAAIVYREIVLRSPA
ncbi:MAG TPA: hypothetical protein VHN11_07280 [Xanthobacteraceae bacterium]|jgi:hypothetical protein|nr:hypothetical protein [Xanthobacteraceae bacterium]